MSEPKYLWAYTSFKDHFEYAHVEIEGESKTHYTVGSGWGKALRVCGIRHLPKQFEGIPFVPEELKNHPGWFTAYTTDASQRAKILDALYRHAAGWHAECIEAHQSQSEQLSDCYEHLLKQL